MRMLRLFRRREIKRDELLSAYLDDQLSGPERERLEARLADDPALRAELEALDHTVSLVRGLPAASAPRNFILAPSMVEGPEPASPLEARSTRRRAWTAPLLTAATVAVSFLFVIVLFVDLLLPGIGGMAHAPAEVKQVEEAPEAVMEAPAEEGERIEAPTSTMAAGPTAEAMLEESAPPLEPEKEEAEDEADLEVTSEAEPSPAPAMEGGGPITEAARLAPTPVITVTEEPPEIPTVPIEASPVPEETVGVVEAVPVEPAVTPTAFIREEEGRPSSLVWPWRALEVALGLMVLGLTFITIRAWRARR